MIDEVPRPAPNAEEMLIRVAAAGVGPWDALIREHKSLVSTHLLATRGSGLAGAPHARGKIVLNIVA